MTTQLAFPAGFLWGAATAAYQVEGGNDNTDWSEWEHLVRPPARLAEPVSAACDHWNRYAQDIAILADLGLNSYRFSVEWARVEPSPGIFDRTALAHYQDMVRVCRKLGITPIVTLQHFTLPRWVAARGGWTDPEIPRLFARYAGEVARALGDEVPYYCTINEPGNMLTRGYLGSFPTPPFVRDLTRFDKAVEGVIAAHRHARDAIKTERPRTRVGIAHALQHWTSNAGGEPAMRYVRALHEDCFFAAAREDDFIGVQTYLRVDVQLPRLMGPLTRLLLRDRTLTAAVMPRLLRRRSRQIEHAAKRRPAGSTRLTQMGYGWAPGAVEHAARRAAALFPGKEIMITEHGVATENDDERIIYIAEGIRAIQRLIADAIPVTGYLHWSLLDNWEWWDGYRPKFGLVAVDRRTQSRTIKPSAQWYGLRARTNMTPDRESTS